MLLISIDATNDNAKGRETTTTKNPNKSFDQNLDKKLKYLNKPPSPPKEEFNSNLLKLYVEQKSSRPNSMPGVMLNPINEHDNT